MWEQQLPLPRKTLTGIMNVNAKGLFLCLQEVIPVMVDNGGGVILNLASIASRLGIADRFAYSASKGSVLAMTLSVAKDYVDKGIRCNCLCPGRVHTPFVDGFLEKYYPDQKIGIKNSPSFPNINQSDGWESKRLHPLPLSFALKRRLLLPVVPTM